VIRTDPLGRGGWLVVAAGGLLLLVLCSLVASTSRVGDVERSVFRAINDLPGWLYPLLWPFQQFGNLLVALVIGIVVALALRQWWVAVAVGAAVALKLLGEQAVKEVVQRSRPGTTIGDVTMRGDVSAHGLSFVSGHAVIVTAVAGLLTPILPKAWRWVPWAIVVLNGVTRIYVGAHSPLDIVGGIGLGLVLAGILNAILAEAGSRRRRAVVSS
jgi:undecaprenyl-diphosphatase